MIWFSNSIPWSECSISRLPKMPTTRSRRMHATVSHDLIGLATKRPTWIRCSTMDKRYLHRNPPGVVNIILYFVRSTETCSKGWFRANSQQLTYLVDERSSFSNMPKNPSYNSGCHAIKWPARVVTESYQGFFWISNISQIRRGYDTRAKQRLISFWGTTDWSRTVLRCLIYCG